MANDTFATFSEVSALQFNDYLVGYRNLTETRVGYSGLLNTFVASFSSDNTKINSIYSTVNVNSASWEESSEILPTVINYLSTTNIILSGVTVADGLSALTVATTSLSTRQITLVHSPANDGTNPSIFIGETDAPGTSGFNIFYDELQNRLTITSTFSGSTAIEVNMDRFGNTNVFGNVVVYGSLSANPLLTDNLSSRQITLLHTPANDGTNPNIFIGETDTAGTSGFNIFYDEIQNRLTVTSIFSGISGAIFSLDRSGNAFGPVFPYTVSFVPFVTAAGNTNVFYPAALSGVIPSVEITSRIREGKGRVGGSFFFVLSATPPNAKNTAVRLQFASNVNFTGATTIFQPDVAAGNVSIFRTIEGFVCNNNSSIIFPSDTQSSIYGAWSSANTLYPYGGDIFYRVGFSAVGVGQLCSLSGGYISIIP